MQQEKPLENPIVGALQPGYLPWLGFFDQVHHADIFILYDDLIYSKKSWRNRNRIKGPKGAQWLTVPVLYGSGQKIREVRIDSSRNWQNVHFRTLNHCYGKAPFFSRYRDDFFHLYREAMWETLCNLNVHIIRYLLGVFGIRTKLLLSSELGFEKSFLDSDPKDSIPTRRIVHFMDRLGAKRFLEGQAGKTYVKEEILEEAGIAIRYQVYRHRSYPQCFGGFIPYLSAVDLLFNCGPDSLEFLVNPNPFDRQN